MFRLECPEYFAAGLVIWLQNWSSTCGPERPGAMCTYGHSYAWIHLSFILFMIKFYIQWTSVNKAPQKLSSPRELLLNCTLINKELQSTSKTKQNNNVKIQVQVRMCKISLLDVSRFLSFMNRFYSCFYFFSFELLWWSFYLLQLQLWIAFRVYRIL